MNRNSSQTHDRQLLDNDAIAAWIFLAPALIFLGIFVLWPIAYLCYLSFTTGSFTQEGSRLVGFRNYWRLLLSPDFWQVLFNTAYFTIATVIAPSALKSEAGGQDEAEAEAAGEAEAEAEAPEATDEGEAKGE